MKRLLFFLFLSHLMTAGDTWPESMMHTLSLEEKIGQLIVMRVNAQADMTEVFDMIAQYAIGAVIPLTRMWTVHTHHDFITAVRALYPNMLTIPIMVLEDCEWGCAMRIPELIPFPKAMLLGTLPAEQHDLIYQAGYAIGMQCKALGIDMNLAPVIDINSNPLNTVIGIRSFGNTAETVTAAAELFTQGLIDAGIIPCFKHFPGHGNTQTDSHFRLPIVTSAYETLWSLDLAPFRTVCTRFPCAVMIGHLAVPGLEPDNGIRPATLSPAIITTLLKDQLHFNGLVVTDALDMKALDNFGTPGQLALAALQAGADLLVCPTDIPDVVNTICAAIENDSYTEAELDEHVLKVLNMKERHGLVTSPKIPTLAVPLYAALIQQLRDAIASV